MVALLLCDISLFTATSSESSILPDGRRLHAPAIRRMTPWRNIQWSLSSNVVQRPAGGEWHGPLCQRSSICVQGKVHGLLFKPDPAAVAQLSELAAVVGTPLKEPQVPGC
jgi:hypothetical protein